MSSMPTGEAIGAYVIRHPLQGLAFAAGLAGLLARRLLARLALFIVLVALVFAAA